MLFSQVSTNFTPSSLYDLFSNISFSVMSFLAGLFKIRAFLTHTFPNFISCLMFSLQYLSLSKILYIIHFA